MVQNDYVGFLAVGDMVCSGNGGVVSWVWRHGFADVYMVSVGCGCMLCHLAAIAERSCAHSRKGVRP